MPFRLANNILAILVCGSSGALPALPIFAHFADLLGVDDLLTYLLHRSARSTPDLLYVYNTQ